MVTLSLMNIAERTIVNNGAVNIKVIASDTGIYFTHANDVSIVRLPNNPRTHSMILWYTEFGQNVSPILKNIMRHFSVLIREFVPIISHYLSFNFSNTFHEQYKRHERNLNDASDCDDFSKTKSGCFNDKIVGSKKETRCKCHCTSN